MLNRTDHIRATIAVDVRCQCCGRKRDARVEMSQDQRDRSEHGLKSVTGATGITIYVDDRCKCAGGAG